MTEDKFTQVTDKIRASLGAKGFDDARLRLLLEAHQHLVTATTASVVDAHEDEGLTWQEIGEGLRMTRQSAWEAFNRYVTQEGRLGGPKRR